MDKNLTGGRCLNAIWWNGSLSSIEKLVLHAFASELDVGGDFQEWRYLPYERWATKTSLTKVCIIRTVKKILDKNYIEINKAKMLGGTGAKNNYRITSKIFEKHEEVCQTKQCMTYTDNGIPGILSQDKQCMTYTVNDIPRIPSNGIPRIPKHNYIHNQDNHNPSSATETVARSSSKSRKKNQTNLASKQNDTALNGHYLEIARYWNDTLTTSPQVDLAILAKNPKRRAIINNAVENFGHETIIKTIERVKSSCFLLGKIVTDKGDKKPFKATLMWALNPENLQKINEGNYDDSKPSSKPERRLL